VNEDQVALVQSSFAKVAPIAPQAAALFYGRLFEIDGTTRPLFAHANMAEQGAKLMATLGTVVAGLRRPEAVVPAAEALARRHVAYGVQEAHYASVGAALLWTLREGLGDAFTPEVEAAWGAAYTLLAGVMIEAASAA
jgi:hemoglobin-like flavoprotein